MDSERKAMTKKDIGEDEIRSRCFLDPPITHILYTHTHVQQSKSFLSLRKTTGKQDHILQTTGKSIVSIKDKKESW